MKRERDRAIHFRHSPWIALHYPNHPFSCFTPSQDSSDTFLGHDPGSGLGFLVLEHGVKGLTFSPTTLVHTVSREG